MTRKSHPDTKRNDATGQGLHVLNHFNISGQIILLFNKMRRIQKASRPVPEGRYAPGGTEPSEKGGRKMKKGGRKKFFGGAEKEKGADFLCLHASKGGGELNCRYTKTSGYALRTWPAQHRKKPSPPPLPAGREEAKAGCGISPRGIRITGLGQPRRARQWAVR